MAASRGYTTWTNRTVTRKTWDAIKSETASYIANIETVMSLSRFNVSQVFNIHGANAVYVSVSAGKREEYMWETQATKLTVTHLIVKNDHLNEMRFVIIVSTLHTIPLIGWIINQTMECEFKDGNTWSKSK